MFVLLDVHHAVYSMLLAVQWLLSALKIEARPPIARIIRAKFAPNVHHTVLGMLLAVHAVSTFDVVALYHCVVCALCPV